MSSTGSVTRWIDQLEAGDHEAAQPLWDRYFPRLVQLARGKLGAKPRVADGEDVALSAFDTFCRGLKDGRFLELQDRDNLWKLLIVLTARKAYHVLRDEQAQIRGGGQTAGSPEELDQVESPEPSPEFAAEFAENCERLMKLLGNDELLRTIALRKLEGYTNEEIAAQVDRVPRTVERKLNRIRRLWKESPS